MARKKLTPEEQIAVLTQRAKEINDQKNKLIEIVEKNRELEYAILGKAFTRTVKENKNPLSDPEILHQLQKMGIIEARLDS